MKADTNNYIEKVWEKSWTYIRTAVDVVHEPILILDKDLRVMAANEPFYRMFQVEAKDTEGKIVYKLGNGQWDIPDLRKLLEDILPKNTFFKAYEVTHIFPTIGKKVMLLNARQIHVQEESGADAFPPIILLAIEDITGMMSVAEKLAEHTNNFQARLTERTQKLETYILKLGKEISDLKKAG